MKKYLSVLMVSFFLLILGLTSCNPEGDCTMVCECDYGVYNSTSSIELGGGYTKDECKEEANIDDVAGCNCTDDWSRSSN
jgi:hypothetical protein